MRMTVRFVLVMFVLGFGSLLQPSNAESPARTVTRASIGKDGLIHILRSDGTEFVAPREVSPVRLTDKDEMQDSVEAPVIAEDGRAVGWLVDFPNCCTSYPIPLVLVVYRDGRIVQRIVPKVRLPIWKWVFLKDGKEVAYYANTVHGDLEPTCELREVSSGKLLDEWRRGEGKALPIWARPFAQDVGIEGTGTSATSERD